MKTFEFSIQNELIKGSYSVIGNKVWVHINGKTFPFDISKSKKNKKSNSSGEVSPEILSPMPGKITSIKKRTGEAVEVGEVVIMMEAMKMEYSLKAQMTGFISQIHCSEGEQVLAEQVLVLIEGKK